LTDDKFLEIRNELEQLEVIPYNPKITEIWEMKIKTYVHKQSMINFIERNKGEYINQELNK
jgi:hypothetical protein